MDLVVTKKKQKKTQKKITKIPGDKSISHRALIFGSLVEDPVNLHGYLFSEDCLNTAKIFQLLGVPISLTASKKMVEIRGVGLHGLHASKKILDSGNSGTGIRLITGVLAGQTFDSEITGDFSIQNRPMNRIIAPLTQMGAKIKGTTRPGKNDTYPPLKIKGQPGLKGIRYEMPIASAQVKSAVLLAGLFSESETVVIEPEKSRDHTERLLQFLGADFSVDGLTLTLRGGKKLKSPKQDWQIPADLSSAAFFLVLGLLCPETKLELSHIGLNPTRVRLIHLLIQMGGDLTVNEPKNLAGEPAGDIRVKTSRLKPIEILKADIPMMIDEIPILAVAALFMDQPFQIRHAQELRIKESDRIKTIVEMVLAIGGKIDEIEDGFTIFPETKFKDFELNSYGDHRIAMSAIIGALAANRNATIKNCDCIATSFPNFVDILLELGFDIQLK